MPEMRIATGEGIKLQNLDTGYELWLTGNADYTVIRYKDELDNRDHLIGVDNSRDDSLTVAQNRLLLIEAKRQHDGESLFSVMPEAVGQAITVAELTSQPEVRFCLSNGRVWKFCIIKKSDSGWVYYESTARHLNKAAVEHSATEVSEILGLVSEWLTPKAEPELYQLLD
ncbi:hypothetical protein H0H92_003979 [Tricholoma furcatifolium]|nr:hypothetical protein H0H92_003979 [Tricholoma furcatifolium]